MLRLGYLKEVMELSYQVFNILDPVPSSIRPNIENIMFLLEEQNIAILYFFLTKKKVFSQKI